MTRPNPTPKEPIVSPRLRRRDTELEGDFLARHRDGNYALCVDELSHFVAVPDAQAFWIEVSTTQWADDSGAEVWFHCVSDVFDGWAASHTRHSTHYCLEGAADRFITRRLRPPRDKPARYFFRLVYED